MKLLIHYPLRDLVGHDAHHQPDPNSLCRQRISDWLIEKSDGGRRLRK